MKIAFLLASPAISGGSYVIFEHALRLSKLHDVSIITEKPIDQNDLNWHPQTKTLTWKTFDDSHYDIAIATWWKTVFNLPKVKAKNYAYFVQSIESRFYQEYEKPLRQLVDATYHLPLHFITEAKWIKKHLRENFSQSAHLTPNGIRKDLYTPHGPTYSKRDPNKLRILIEGPLDVPFKNIKKTIELCNQSKADETWLLTSSPASGGPKVDRIFSKVPIHEVSKIYRSCDLIVKLSYVEGMFGPPLEMFHCGGTAITYNVSGHDEYIIHDHNALVAKTDDEAKVIQYINQLKSNPQKLAQLKEKAAITARKWPSWNRAHSEFQIALNKISQKSSINAKELQQKTDHIYQSYQIAEQYRLKLEPPPKQRPRHRLNNYLLKNFPRTHRKLKKIKHSFKIQA